MRVLGVGALWAEITHEIDANFMDVRETSH